MLVKGLEIKVKRFQWASEKFRDQVKRLIRKIRSKEVEEKYFVPRYFSEVEAEKFRPLGKVFESKGAI